MKANEIRQSFLNFFKEKQHHIVPSAPMVIKNDPTLMFTNAGMNQFKDIFLGNSPVQHKRIADSQKCLRVSGKHNDLEEVGKDTYHHTMFEMLGNWSFGDYFKKEAIAWAWEFLTEVLKLDKNILYVTVFEGDEKDGTQFDREAFDYWKAIIAESHILKGNKKDNFWEMGDTGPCGPCSEIHVDLRSEEEKAKISGRDLVNNDHPLVVEIWNLVFMQFNRMANGQLVELPAKHVDTGMGFERLCMAIQKKQSNYDTDVFQPLILALSKMSGILYGKDEKTDIAMRVIADHIRAVSFAIADGQLPSNNKAGYVIRRILRRAVRYGYTFLNFREPFICRLFPVLMEEMGDQYPELKAQKELIYKVIAEEEQSFLRTLESGIKLIDQLMDKAKQQNQTVISGKDAFIAYDTYGFPIDLTNLILQENGFSVNHAEFEQELLAQKERSRKAASVDADDWVVIHDGEETQFVGYDMLSCDVKLLRYRKITTKNKEQYQLVFDQTPFYAESGGQVGDKGYIENPDGEKIYIINTKKENNLSIHITEKLPADCSQTFKAVVDTAMRAASAANHSATHLMHYALRQVLGTHVEQKGSLVSPDLLRFDFSHFQKVTDEEIRQVERLVNKMIRRNIILDEERALPIEKAKELGAMALFGEKYGDVVRVIKFGDSVELCGGTHVHASGEIGFFKIISESAIAAGVRRIEAITAEEAENMTYELVDTLKHIKQMFKAAPNVVSAVEKIIMENETLAKQMESYFQERLLQVKTKLLQEYPEQNGIRLIEAHGLALPELIKGLAFEFKKDQKNMVFIATMENDNKPSLHLMLGEEFIQKGFNASQIIREASKEIKGSGGGQPFYASAGGSDATGLPAAVQKIKSLLGL